jgi:hypothetical protein
MITSTPRLFSAAVAGRNTRGVASGTLAAGGNTMAREGANVALREALVLQGSGRVSKGSGAAEDAHAPAVAAVVDALAQHWHAAQPTVCTAGAAQQQPPRHTLVPQSAADAQGSPGEPRKQPPIWGAQLEQPSRAAVEEQQ